MMTENLSITKMSGSGNDFILVDHRQSRFSDPEKIRLARALCRRGLSVGADGLIFIEPSKRYDFKWRFFNADGSEAEMCGNGGRCAVRFARMIGMAGREMTFETLAGPIQAWVNGREVKLQLTVPREARLAQLLPIEARELEVDFINTGVPHTVVWVEDLEAVNLPDLGPRIRFHSNFQPAGTNVNFVKVLGENTLAIRTYERGVEAETLACGTGAVAAASLVFLKRGFGSPVSVQTRGGEKLLIYLEGVPGERIDRVFLEGRVTLVFQGEATPEALE